MPATAVYYESSDNAGQTSTANLIRMFCRPLSAGSGGPDPNPATAGAAVAAEINAADEAEIWVHPNKMIQVLDNDAAPSAASVGDMLINGPNIGLRRQRATLFYEALRDSLDDGIVIDGLHIDEEPNFFGTYYPYYNLGGSSSARGTVMFNVLQDKVLRRFFPSYMWDLTESQLQAFDTWDGTVGSKYAKDWDRVMLGRLWQSIRENCVDPFAQVFGYLPKTVLNYDDENLVRDRKYESGQPLGKGGRTMAGVSCPALWLSGDAANAYSGMSYPNWWNSLIYNLNWLRSIRGPMMPQISRPGFDGDSNPFISNFALWDEMMKHAGAMGIGRYTSLVSGWDSTDKSHMQSVLAGLDVKANAPTRWEIIPYDSPSITTNGVTTVYNSSLGTGRVTS